MVYLYFVDRLIVRGLEKMRGISRDRNPWQVIPDLRGLRVSRQSALRIPSYNTLLLVSLFIFPPIMDTRFSAYFYKKKI